jgi:hypothetical protein
VCADLDEPRTRDRELHALTEAAAETGCRPLTLVTWDEEGEERAGKGRISVVAHVQIGTSAQPTVAEAAGHAAPQGDGQVLGRRGCILHERRTTRRRHVEKQPLQILGRDCRERRVAVAQQHEDAQVGHAE